MLFSRVYYDQCQWTDAIAALEHAYACYVKIGGDMGAIRGAIDAARRLARVYLRAGPAAISDGTSTGHLDTAFEWLVEAQQVRHRRSDAILNGQPSRFRLYDVLLDAQLNQISTQIELTRQALDWEDVDAEVDVTPQAVVQFVSEPYQYVNGQTSTYSRLDEAQQALSLLQRIRGLRLVPEFKMHLARLFALASDSHARDCLDDLENWFTNEKLRYQTDLLDAQRLVLTAPATAMLFIPDAADLFTEIEQVSDQVREVMQAARNNPTAVGDRYYTAAYAMRTHHNPYWHARGLAAALIIGLVTDRERSWLDGVRAELDEAATRIGRIDWIEKANGYGDTNGGLWLLGY